MRSTSMGGPITAATGSMAIVLGTTTHANVERSWQTLLPMADRVVEGAPPGGAPGEGGGFESGFEPPCFVGYIGGGGSGDPQNCDWRASLSARPGYQQPTITDTNPRRGRQQLHFEHDPNQPFGLDSRNWAFSEEITPPPERGVAYIRLGLSISRRGGGNTCIIQPQAPSQEMLTAQMHFNPDGTIGAADDNGNCEDNLFQPNIPTDFEWIPGEYVTVEICVDEINDRIRYYYDGKRVYSTGAGEGGIGGPLGCGVFAGSIIEQVLIRFDENANDGTWMDIDEVLIINTPDGRPECPPDFDGSGDVGFGDLLSVLSHWGTYEPCPPFEPEDLDESCEVDFVDLITVLAAWGPCREFICPEP